MFVLVVLMPVVLLAMTMRWFVFPAEDAPRQADAVVVFAGGTATERFDTALELMERNVAPVLVLNQSGKPWYLRPDSPDPCSDPQVDFELICVTADPSSTSGEAAIFGDIAAQRGWDSVVLVTSRDHVHRAEMWLGRCFDGAIEKVGAHSPFSSDRVVHEWGGTLHALLWDRSCPAHRGTVTGGSVQPT